MTEVRFFEVLPERYGIRYRVDPDGSVRHLVDVHDHDSADITAETMSEGNLPTVEMLERGAAAGIYQEW